MAISKLSSIVMSIVGKNRIKEIENPPIEGEGKKFDILLELGKLFLGKKK